MLTLRVWQTAAMAIEARVECLGEGSKMTEAGELDMTVGGGRILLMGKRRMARVLELPDVSKLEIGDSS